MKKIILYLVFSVMAASLMAQVDYSVLKKPTLWASKNVDMDYHKAVYFNNGKIYRYCDGKIPKDKTASKNKSLRKPHLSINIFNFFDGEYKIVDGKFDFVHTAYWWNITKLTNKIMIIKRGKRKNNSDFIYDREWVRTYTFTRMTNVKDGYYPLFESFDGSMQETFMKDENGSYDMTSRKIYLKN